MSDSAANRSACVCVAVSTLFLCPGTLAGDALPEAAFLEYLGSWEESDEEWVWLAGDEYADTEETESRDRPVQTDEESREQDDEG